MTNRILLLITTIACNLSLLHAQTSVSGNVKDKDKSPLQGCTVYFLQADTLAGGGITDKKGNFCVKGLQPGNYICRISMVGFKKIEHSFKLAGDIRLPQFTLEEDATQLEEVTVTGDKRNIVKSGAGSTTFFLSEHAKKAQTAYDALVEIPKLLVNPIDRNIKLITGDNPLILIDGVKRPNYIDVLRPELIESVEIIETPSARYLGSEGTSCILNIHLKRIPTPSYFNGNVFTQHAVTSGHGTTGVNLETGNTHSSLYLNARHFYYANEKSNYYSETQSGDILQKLSQIRNFTQNSYYAGIGGDRIFSNKNYTAFNIQYVEAPSDRRMESKGSMEYLSDGRKSNVISRMQNDNKYRQATAYLYYKHTFSKKQTLEATSNYIYGFSGSEGEQDDVNDFYKYNKLINLKNNNHFGKLSLDYTNIIKNKYTFSAGSNSTYSSISINDMAEKFPVYHYKKWQEYLYAGFDNNRSGSKFNYSISLGMDMLFTKAGQSRNHYIDVLPALALTYKFNQKHTLSLNYSRARFSPSAGQLNPRNTSTDSLYVQQGNPYLTPQFLDHVQFAYRLNYKRLYLEPFISYDYSSDIISGVSYMEDNVYISTYQNLLCANFLKIGAILNYNLPFGNINMMGNYQKKSQKGMAFNGESLEISFNGNFYYKNVSLRLAGGYSPDRYTLTQKIEKYLWSQADLSWNLPKGWKVALMAQNFILSKKNYRTWAKDKNYRLFFAGRMTDRNPMLQMHVTYSFKNKVAQKWRQRKMFYGTKDCEAKEIKVNVRE
ncbi:outer membrane beta-barrel protein [Bacteroides sp.]|uniref:TonB-dependent receptor n=1 Tax=Bacteroides sp. TaxID=29523 RepID=UPI0023CD0C62|nr:outer membrane beta-barrel protein [Bacteroides sp.]MDE6216417.1 outer membrane beta-barrel protein [Bacteroides sp.]